jgi:hypothetical protein
MPRGSEPALLLIAGLAPQSPAPKRDNTSEAAPATPPRTTSAQIASVQMVPEQATAADPAFSETPVREHVADTQTAADAEEQMPLTWPVTVTGRAGQKHNCC